MPSCATQYAPNDSQSFVQSTLPPNRDERLQDIKPASLKRSLVPVRHLFEIASDEWGIPLQVNPLDKLSLDVTDPRRERRLQPGEWARLLGAARTCRNPSIEPIVRLAVATGMRRSELLAIRSDHIDMGARTLVIPNSKNGTSRHIPLSSEAVDILRIGLGTPQAPGRHRQWLPSSTESRKAHTSSYKLAIFKVRIDFARVRRLDFF
jgi:integrase